MRTDGARNWVAALVVIAALIGLWLRHRAHPVAAAVTVPQSMSRFPQITPSMPPSIEKAPARAGGPRLVGATTAEICGLGRVPLDASDPFAVGRFLESHTQAPSRAWLHALLESDDVRARATGLLLESKLTVSDEHKLANDTIPPTEDQARDALVQLAVGAGDPAVYAMAVYACNTDMRPALTGSCEQLSLDTWATLDPDNAVPWLLIARQARASNDGATESSAFGRAAHAARTDAYSFSLYAFAEPELPSDATPVERAYLAIELIGVESALGSLHYIGASKHCSDAAMQDGGVRQQCAALAELFVSKGTNLLDLSFGIHLGDRAGWSKARVAAMLEDRDALMQVITQVNPGNSDDRWTCDAVSRGNAYMSRWAHLGELGAARDALEWSGETVAELALKQRDYTDKMRRDAQREPEVPAPDATP